MPEGNVELQEEGIEGTPGPEDSDEDLTRILKEVEEEVEGKKEEGEGEGEGKKVESDPAKNAPTL
jgi:hypothetical protein